MSVVINPGSGGGGGGRTLLTANATYYVNSATGNDSNSGSSGSPWATLQHAWGVLQSLDGNSYDATVHCIGAGPYRLEGLAPSPIGFNTITILGDGTPTVMSTCAFGQDLLGTGTIQPYALLPLVNLDYFEFNDGDSNGYGLLSYADGTITLGNSSGSFNGTNSFGPISQDQIFFSTKANLIIYGTLDLSGSSGVGIFANLNAKISIDSTATVNFAGGTSYGVSFLFDDAQGQILDKGATYTGSYTGISGLVANNAYFEHLNPFPDGDPTYLPGSSPIQCFQGGVFAFLDDTHILTPLTGTTVSLTNYTTSPKFIVNPAGTLASLAFDLPPISSNPLLALIGVNLVVELAFMKQVTSASFASTDGSSVTSAAPSTITAGTIAKAYYDQPNAAWYIAA